MKVATALRGVTTLGLDTAPVVYFVQSHPTFYPLCEPFFKAIAAGEVHAVAGMVTLTEVLVHPLRNGDTALANAYRTLLTDAVHLRLAPVTAATAEYAAFLRAKYPSLKTPDALQLAAAWGGGCEAFLTGDAKLRQVTEIKVLVLSEIEL